LIKLLSVIFGLLVSSSVIKISIITDEFTDWKSAPKKLFTSFRLYFPWEACDITDKNTICNSIGDYLKIFLKKSI
jgi:hypothetical protein